MDFSYLILITVLLGRYYYNYYFTDREKKWHWC